MGPFDRFNDRAKRVLALAQDEAIRFNHNYIGTEHLLLGLVREGEGVAARVLDSLGVELSQVRRAIEFAIGRGDATTSPSEITLAPPMKKAVELAIDEARKLGHSHVGTEHLLLGIVRQSESTAAKTLESLGVDLEKVRHEVIATLGQPHREVGASAPASVSPQSTRDLAGPFDRFNDGAKRVLGFAQDEAIRLRHNYIGTEHLLLGLVREGESVAARVLESLGVELSKVRTSVEFIIGAGDAPTAPSEITLSPRTKRVVELAIDEARILGHRYVGPEHILLGLVREGQGIASGVLESLGLTMEKVHQQVLAALGRTSTRHFYGADRPAGFEGTRPLDRLDDASRRVLALAQNEAVGLGHTWIGTDHLLLGLISANGTIAQRALSELGLALEPVRAEVAKADRPSIEWQAPMIAHTPRAERLLSGAANLAGRGPIQPESLLLAYAGDPECAGSRILAAVGVTPAAIRETINRLTPPS